MLRAASGALAALVAALALASVLCEPWVEWRRNAEVIGSWNVVRGRRSKVALGSSFAPWDTAVKAMAAFYLVLAFCAATALCVSSCAGRNALKVALVCHFLVAFFALAAMDLARASRGDMKAQIPDAEPYFNAGWKLAISTGAFAILATCVDIFALYVVNPDETTHEYQGVYGAGVDVPLSKPLRIEQPPKAE